MINNHGSMVALVTPFSRGRVDKEAIKNLVKWHSEQGTDAIVIVGSTGESFLLTEEERIEAIKAAVKGKKLAQNEISIIAGVGSPSTEVTVAMAKNAEKCEADAIMIVTPCYVKPTQAGAIEHFKKVINSTKLPVILYNHPFRTATSLNVSTLVRLCEEEQQIIAIKDSSGNLENIGELCKLLPKRVTVLSGDDALNLCFLAQGAQGIISVTANIFPKLCKKFVDSWQKGDIKDSTKIHNILLPVHKAMFCEPNPCPAKYALYKMGKIENEVRLPLLSINDSDNSAATIHEAIKNVLKLEE